MEEEIKEFNGRVNFIGDIKALGPSGKFLSLGIKLDNDPPERWHNITGFKRNEILEKLRNIEVGNQVTLKEKQVGNYWNVIEIVKPERIEVQLPVQPIEPIKVTQDDMSLFHRCIEDAKKIADRHFREPGLEQSGWPYLIKPEDLLKISISLFIQRMKA